MRTLHEDWRGTTEQTIGLQLVNKFKFRYICLAGDYTKRKCEDVTSLNTDQIKTEYSYT